ncbi:cytochrome bd-I ubiquinol oxidase subunit 1 apoprotein [Persephonella hydrogeniphila]|uniref:Cytochrome bd-I ubiquinol oxidase subunit 1 apoprotein n=1 Tax=Persephonella hydrogeniphila TaxID=198703 RepID=A0A285NNP3_9AQUI|nr:cytochrome ubiquinol oxidase subunit I [Persephonella hydrogeniphila]SNZ11069.1 cytochrome bd-I ubiquinol oxidase subunit 1 apoprotein [Persephonella hydrogeniphila]
MDLLTLSRIQFGMTAFYHFLFVPLTLGLAFMIAILKTIYLRNKDERYDRLAMFLMKLFAINFAVGVATGLTMEFEFGTNWFTYSKFVGDIFGAPLAIEGLMAFFLESTFIGLFLFGKDRVSDRMHTFAAWMVALGSTLSALWILIANSWMQTPAGYKIVETPQGVKAVLTDFWEAVINHTTIFRFLHCVDAGYIVGGFFVMGIMAFYLLKNRETEIAKIGLKFSLIFTAIVSVLQIIFGDIHGYQVTHGQPLKMAMMEGKWETEKGASLDLFGIVNQEKQETKVILKIPYLLSILSYHDPKAEFKGIKELVQEYRQISEKAKEKIPVLEEKLRQLELNNAPKNEIEKLRSELALAKANARAYDINFKDLPSVALVFTTFHIMVYLGFFFAFITLWGLYLLKKGTIYTNKAFLWTVLLSIPLPYIATEFGWIAAEVGRQPWLVQGVLLTKDGVSFHPTGNVWFSLIFFTLIYTGIFIVFLYAMIKAVKKGPQSEKSQPVESLTALKEV